MSKKRQNGVNQNKFLFDEKHSTSSEKLQKNSMKNLELLYLTSRSIEKCKPKRKKNLKNLETKKIKKK